MSNPRRQNPPQPQPSQYKIRIQSGNSRPDSGGSVSCSLLKKNYVHSHYERNIHRKICQTNQVVLKSSFLTLTFQLHSEHNHRPIYLLTSSRPHRRSNRILERTLVPESISLATTILDFHCSWYECAPSAAPFFPHLPHILILLPRLRRLHHLRHHYLQRPLLLHPQYLPHSP